MGKNKKQLVVNNSLIREFMTNAEKYLPESKVEDLTAELEAQNEIITQLEAKLDAVGAVDITPQVDRNTSLINQIMTELEGKAIPEAVKPEGLYVWKKYDTKGGNLIGYITSNDPTEYPDNDTKDGFYYVGYVKELKIVTWAGGTDEEISAMLAAHYDGIINVADYWSIGDERNVILGNLTQPNDEVAPESQEATMVLMHKGGYYLTDGEECAFVVGVKNCFKPTGKMNPSSTNAGTWKSCPRRTWCNEIVKNAFPSSWQNIFKQFKTITATEYNATTNTETIDYFAIPAAMEVLGTKGYSPETEANALFQFEYYKTTSNRIKTIDGTAVEWWNRSPYTHGQAFCAISTAGGVNGAYSNGNLGFSPFGCI